MKAYRKYLARSIKKDLSRLLAILVIVLLGVGFLIGLLQAGPDIQAGADRYFKDTALSDVTIQTPLGLTKETADELLQLDDENPVYNLKTEIETEAVLSGKKAYAKLVYQSFSDARAERLELKSGRWPQAPDECVLLTGNSTLAKFQLGDRITYAREKKAYDYEIVGTVYSSSFFTRQQLNSYLSSKKLDAVAFFDLGTTINPLGEVYTTLGLAYTYPFTSFTRRYTEFIGEKIRALKSAIESAGLAGDNALTIARSEVKKAMIASLEAEGKQAAEIAATLADPQIKAALESAAQREAASLIEEGAEAFYVLDRESNPAYTLLKADIDKVIQIARIFPIFFFLIAVLVASTSGSRIVSTDRQLMGTFKSQGYTAWQILKKYIFYGAATSVVGSLLGVVSGLFLLPYIIYLNYCSIYRLPYFIFGFNPLYILTIVGLMICCIMGVILIYAVKELRSNAAKLMLDKVPKPGKKILLERLKPLWRAIPFRFKSMFRNVFRFKKNLLMMALGVGGCTGILLTGFGVSDSLRVLTTRQYEQLFNYNFIVKTDEPDTFTGGFERQTAVYYADGATIDGESAYAFTAIGGNELDHFVELPDFGPDSVVVTTQLKEHYSLRIGETFEIMHAGATTELTLSGVAENYVGNYLYLGSSALLSLPGNPAENAVLAYRQLADGEVNDFIDQLLATEGVEGVNYTGSSLATYDNLLDNLTSIVLLLIIISGLLLVTVMYNLIDINISERRKEVATLKVLGYQKGELMMYIFREVILMTIIGIGVGIAAGYLLHYTVIRALTSPGLLFGRTISWISYLLTILLTLTFSVVVTAILSHKIAKINMVESLKSVD